MNPLIYTKFKIDPKLAKKIILAGASFALSFILLDFLLFRVFPKPCQFTQKDKTLGQKLSPGITCQVKTDEYNVTYHINSIGLRDTEIPQEKNDYFRLLMLGDSFTFGTGVNLEDTAVQKLEKFLQEYVKDEKIEVINAGVGGYAASEQFLYLANDGIKLAPDLVVVNLSMNDFTEEHAALRNTKGEKQILPTGLSGFLKNNSFIYNLFLKNQEKLTKTKAQITARVTSKPIPEDARKFDDFTQGDLDRDLFAITRELSDEKFDKLFTPVADRLTEMRNYLFSKNIPMLLVIIPNGHQVSPNEWASGRRIFKFDNRVYPRKVFEQLKKFGQEQGIPVVDTSLDLIEYKNQNFTDLLYYDYDGHLTSLGQAIVARSIYNGLLDNYSKILRQK